jgi:hypothetical protein
MPLAIVFAAAQIAHEADDGSNYSYQGVSNEIYLNATTTSSTRYNAGILFDPVNVSGKIHRAWIEYELDLFTEADADVDIYCEDVDSPDNFTITADVTSRVTTTATTAWNDGAAFYTVKKNNMLKGRTPDFAPSVQEVVDRGGWSSGGAIMVLLKAQNVAGGVFHIGTGFGTPVSPKLYVLYTESGELASHGVLTDL